MIFLPVFNSNYSCNSTLYFKKSLPTELHKLASLFYPLRNLCFDAVLCSIVGHLGNIASTHHLAFSGILFSLFACRFSISCRGGRHWRPCLWTATVRCFCKWHFDAYASIADSIFWPSSKILAISSHPPLSHVVGLGHSRTSQTCWMNDGRPSENVCSVSGCWGPTLCQICPGC